MVAGGAAVPAGGGVAGPDGRLYSIVAVAFILATSVVDAVAPSSRSIAFGALRPSTTSTVTFYPSARHFAIASFAFMSATSSVSTFDVGSCANPLVERAAIAAVNTTRFVRFIMLRSSQQMLIRVGASCAALFCHLSARSDQAPFDSFVKHRVLR